MNIGFLATGDELIIGDTLNTNTQKIAQFLHSENLPVGQHLICSDNETDILQCMNFLCERHSTLIISGGLGPTSDDRTRYALSQLTNSPLIEFSESIEHIRQRLASVQLPLTDENRQQALFPENAKLLSNPNGTAMGCCVAWEHHLLFLLPGPPRECLPMFESYVLPILKEKHDTTKLATLKWLLFGAAEGAIAAILDNSLANMDCRTGYRLDMPYLEFKVHCKPQDINTIEKIINPIVEPYLLAHRHEKASVQLARFITLQKSCINIIDTLTGGQLQIAIQKPENHRWLTFNHWKNRKILNVEITGLTNYWQQNEEINKAHASITCMLEDNIMHQQEDLMPFRYRNHPLVLQYATEWVSAKILHILNQHI